MIRIDENIAIREDELEERFIRGSGPGGQNVNKVATAVQVRLDIAATSLPAAVKHRLKRLGGHRVTAEGVLVIEAREYRTQAQNRVAARERLRALLEQAAVAPVRRVATRPTRASRVKRLDAKHRQAERKQSRRRPTDD